MAGKESRLSIILGSVSMIIIFFIVYPQVFMIYKAPSVTEISPIGCVIGLLTQISGIIYCYLAGALVHFYGNLLLIPGTIYISYRSLKTALNLDDVIKEKPTDKKETLIYHHKIPIEHKH